MKSRPLSLVVILHSKLNIRKSHNLLGTMTSIMTSAHHSIVFSVAGRANAYTAVFHLVIILFSRGQSSIGFFGCPFVQFKTFLALSVFQNEHTIPWTPTHNFTHFSQWGEKACSFLSMFVRIWNSASRRIFFSFKSLGSTCFESWVQKVKWLKCNLVILDFISFNLDLLVPRRFFWN